MPRRRNDEDEIQLTEAELVEDAPADEDRLPWLGAYVAAKLGLAACLLLAVTPYLIVWYLAWAVPVAGADEERWGRLGCLAFTAYLLPQTIPL